MEAAKNLLIYVNIVEGYSFRNMIGTIKSEIGVATMIFTPTDIEISFANKLGQAVHIINIKGGELSDYRYNVRDDDDNILPEYPVAFETDDFYKSTKNIGRKDGIKFYINEGARNINVQQIRTGGKDVGKLGALFVKILNVEHTKFAFDDDDIIYREDPDLKIQAKEFAELCTRTGAFKCKTLTIEKKGNEVKFLAVTADDSIKEANVYKIDASKSPALLPTGGEEDDEDMDFDEFDKFLEELSVDTSVPTHTRKYTVNIVNHPESVEVKIPIKTVRALAKIHNMSTTGSQLKFHFAIGHPVKIVSRIGVYGTYIIYLI